MCWLPNFMCRRIDADLVFSCMGGPPCSDAFRHEIAEQARAEGTSGAGLASGDALMLSPYGTICVDSRLQVCFPAAALLAHVSRALVVLGMTGSHVTG